MRSVIPCASRRYTVLLLDHRLNMPALCGSQHLLKLESILRKATRLALRDWYRRLGYTTSCLLLGLPQLTDRDGFRRNFRHVHEI